MAIKTIEYTVDIAGVLPANEQVAGTQGDHRVTKLNFTLSNELYNSIVNTTITGKAMYRFNVYDGEGGVWQSEAKELDAENVSIELEERHTRFGGKIIVYLVITALSLDNETEMELYSFPVMLRLKSRPEGVQKAGENYESVTGLAEIAKQKANEASTSAVAAEIANKKAQDFAAVVEEKLKNGEFDGVGVKTAQIVDDELIITYTNGVSQNLGNVKGATGAQGIQGEKGDKGDTPDVSGFVEKQKGNGFTYQVYAIGDADGMYDEQTLEVEDHTQFEYRNNYGQIPRRQSNGNLMTKTPEKDLDCANKKYVDDGLVSNKKYIDENLGDYVKSVKSNSLVLYSTLSTGNGITTVDGISDNVFASGSYGTIPRRNNNGNLRTYTPINDVDCANKKYVDDAVSNLSGLKIVVSTLPSTGDADTLYFVPSTLTSDKNLYDEYIYANGAWEKIGSAAVEVNLTDYVKNTDYATSSKGGVIKPSDTYAVSVNGSGGLMCATYSTEQYAKKSTACFISKGTLDNVLDAILGDIETALDELHNYAQSIVGGAE